MGLLEPQQPGPGPKLPIRPTLVDSGKNLHLASCQRAALGSHAFWLAHSSLDKYGHMTQKQPNLKPAMTAHDSPKYKRVREMGR